MQTHPKQENRLWDYTISKKLGKGTSGQVFQVLHKSSTQIFALKKISVTGTHDKQKIQAFKEIKCLSLLSHPSIIEYKESFLSTDHIYIVMEYAQKGDFLKVIEERKRKQKYYKEDQLWKIFEQIVMGIKYLHEKNIIHRDIKLQNIFLTQDGKIKIGDLGLAKIMSKHDELISTRVGTPLYFAPEMIQNQLYTFPVDVWSLGCVLYYLATLQHPFQDATIQTLAYYAIDRDPKPIKVRYSVEMVSFINSCLEKDIKNRPNIFQLALRIKNKKQSQPQRNNKVSIFSAIYLNKILKASAQQLQNPKTQRKNNTPSSPRKTFTFLSQRRSNYQEKNIFYERKIHSSNDNRQLLKNNYFKESPESPTLKRKFSQPDQPQNYLRKIMAGDRFQEMIQSPIKSSGFSFQRINKNDSPIMNKNSSPVINKNNSQVNFSDGMGDIRLISPSPSLIFSQKKSISRRSYR